MKKHTQRLAFTATLLILFISQAHSASVKWADGYVVTLSGDTLYGKIKIWVDAGEELLYARMQDRIHFRELGSRKRFSFLPAEIKLFYFYYNFSTPTFESVPFYKEGALFLELVDNRGALRMYRYYPEGEKSLASAYELAEYVYDAPGFGERYFFYLINESDEVCLIGKHTPRQKMVRYFGSCPAVARKIDNREYGYTDIYRIVREYNDCIRNPGRGE
ncbi:MAG: hypothetical protein Kow00127_03750 [Bacteroidales bacterium]